MKKKKYFEKENIILSLRVIFNVTQEQFNIFFQSTIIILIYNILFHLAYLMV